MMVVLIACQDIVSGLMSDKQMSEWVSDCGFVDDVICEPLVRDNFLQNPTVSYSFNLLAIFDACSVMPSTILFIRWRFSPTEGIRARVRLDDRCLYGKDASRTFRETASSITTQLQRQLNFVCIHKFAIIHSRRSISNKCAHR